MAGAVAQLLSLATFTTLPIYATQHRRLTVTDPLACSSKQHIHASVSDVASELLVQLLFQRHINAIYYGARMVGIFVRLNLDE